MTTIRKLSICDSCATAVYDESPDPDMTRADMASLAAVYGASIGDHDCEALESGELCDCRCPGARRAARSRRPA